MKNTRQSITLKVVVGYLLIAALAAIAVWFVYGQVRGYTSLAENDLATNKKLYLVSDAATNLYQAESLSRQVIRTGDSTDLANYRSKIDSIRITLDALQQTYTDTVLQKEIDSINFLLSQKTFNLEELLELRAQEENQSYYAKVINELKKVDESFEENDYEKRFANLEPHQRRVLVKLLEYARMENAEPVSNLTVDSLVNSVKAVLIDFEQSDRRFRETMRQKENELLTNEININSQLRSLLSTIEEEERKSSLAQVESSQILVKKTSRTIAILGAMSFLIIIISLFLVVRDVSNSQRYRNKLEKAKKYAETLLKSREQFMTTVTHDLRSPLNTVMGYTSLLEKSNLNTSQQHYLNHLKKSSDYILRLVNDLLDLSKLEAGKMLIEELPFDLKNLIEDTVENCVPLERSDKVEVRTRISEEIDRPIISDPFRIKQILMNLVTNACKFTEEGYIEVEAFLEKEKRLNQLVVIVKDTGIGISEEKKGKIFEEFSQESIGIEKRFGGSGLGLAISKKLVELSRGSIHLESEQGKGSEFKIRIPVRLSENFTPPPVQEEEVNPARVGDFSVLIVDDEPAQISLLSELVRVSGMKPKSSTNGEEALAMLQKEKFDLVLTDIQMPRMDGFSLLENIRKNENTRMLPVIALSGRTDVLPEEYLRKGFSGSLLKPYSPQELISIIEKALKVSIQKRENLLTEKLNGREGFSLEEVNLFAGGDKKALDKIIKAFIESSRTNLQQLREAQVNKDKEKMAAIAHKMLPMVRQLKAASIVARLERFEDPEVRNSLEELQEISQELNQLLEDLQETIY